MDTLRPYWGVTCECGEFQPLREGSEQKPNDETFKFICTHRGDRPVIEQEVSSESLVLRYIRTDHRN